MLKKKGSIIEAPKSFPPMWIPRQKWEEENSCTLNKDKIQ